MIRIRTSFALLSRVWRWFFPAVRFARSRTRVGDAGTYYCLDGSHFPIVNLDTHGRCAVCGSDAVHCA